MRLPVVVATILSLVALAPAVGASSPRSGVLLLTKDCTAYGGAAGDTCTITSSSLGLIKVGSTVVYAEAADFGTMTLDTEIVINGPGANSAFGHVTLNLATGEGSVMLEGGTGALTWLQASAAVSHLDGPNWGWEGEYSFSPQD
jgi:hypothetical protein